MPSSNQQLSIRVPWHDRGWDGTVCAAPSRNDACLVLPRINEERVDAIEDDLSESPKTATSRTFSPASRPSSR
jgi:hypothetical protein